MLFNSIEYLFCFIPIVFILYFLINKFKLYKFATFFLFLASLYFYGTYKINYIYIIICSILFNYVVSLVFKTNLAKNIKKFTVALGIAGNIGLLIFFKYINYLIEAINNISASHFNTLEIIIPLGISFFTLQQISYIVDCYKGTVENYNLLDYALFVCFFPQFIAGPIVRHQEMIPQFRNIKNRVINQENIFIGIFLITVGLLKKTVFADGFSDFIDSAFYNQTIYSEFIITWFWGCAKLLQTYFDYSGYCDLAMGSAFLFNISLPWNFNSPYKATGIIDFWKRYNMTLIRFLKDYVYKPLGADKKGPLRTCLNILTVFLINGIWMGSNLVNIAYGLLNGILVCINKLWQKLNIHIPIFISRIITFITLIFLTPFLFVKNIDSSIKIIKTLLGINANFTGFVTDRNYWHFVSPDFHLRISGFLLILALIIVFFAPNSMELSRKYVKANNAFYTIILTIVFVYSVLSITKGAEFLYYIF